MKKYSKNIITFLLISVLSITTCYLGYKSYLLESELNSIQKSFKDDITSYEDKINNIESDLNQYERKLIEETQKFKNNYMANRQGAYSIEELNKLDLSNYEKLIISTHPDDEMFWAGGHLLMDDYLVVCVTCGMDANRQKEFEKSMKDTEDKYIMLQYPRSVDPSLNREFDWRATSYLTQDLENIINLKNWEVVVTHNPAGEYGHKYHKLTSQVVTALVKDKSKLYYFGIHYNTDELDKLSTDTLKDDIYNRKLEIIKKNYLSQSISAQKHGHMFRNENFIKFSDWK